MGETVGGFTSDSLFVLVGTFVLFLSTYLAVRLYKRLKLPVSAKTWRAMLLFLLLFDLAYVTMFVMTIRGNFIEI